MFMNIILDSGFTQGLRICGHSYNLLLIPQDILALLREFSDLDQRPEPEALEILNLQAPSPKS